MVGDKPKHLVVFQPSGRRGYVEAGKSLLEAARELGVGLESLCGGHATCGKCLVRIEEGFFEKEGIRSGRSHLSPLAEAEKKFVTARREAEGYRLACVARVYGDALIFVPEESRKIEQIVRKAVSGKPVKLKPAVRKYYVELSPPVLDAPTADGELLQAGLKDSYGLGDLTIDYSVLRSLQQVLRQGGWKATVSVRMGREVIEVEPGFVSKCYGLAVDIGTTTLAGYLCDLTTGEIAATEFMMNPQIPYGEDVISRITYAVSNKDGLKKMHRAVISAINLMAQRVAKQAGIRCSDIVDMAVVGNTCMHHLFLGINPEYLGRSPFVPAVFHSQDVRARELGIRISPGAYVHVLPVEAGFVGADNVGVLIAEEPYNQDEMWLIADMGTNTELVLGNRKRLVCCSCATGPTFEGAHIKYGMRAAEGAIERVEIDAESKEVRFKVIGKEEWSTERGDMGVRGICGSGIIDAVAQMFLAGIIRRDGRIEAGSQTPRLRNIDGVPEFVIAWAKETAINQDITINQADVRMVQLAKGALYAGARLAMRKMGVETVDKVILAGAFGSYVSPGSVLAMGLLPPIAVEKIEAVGNAAGFGACLTLFNADKRVEADKIARLVEYIELATEADFQKEFTQAMYFPH